MKSVVKSWLFGLTFKQQTVLLSALRGCDGKNKEDVSKTITRYFRYLVLKNADNDTSFMQLVSEAALLEIFTKFFSDIDSYPMHFILHLFHAIEIIGYKHPEVMIRNFWRDIYFLFCETIHLNPESELQLNKRLSDNKKENL